MRNKPREDLLSCHRRHVRAWSEKNLDRLREIYADDAVVFNTEPPARFSDFKTFENTLHQHFAKIGEVSFLTSNIQIEVQTSTAWVCSQYLKEYRVNGSIVRQSGRWTEVYTCDSGDWKLVHLHSSLDPEGAEIL